jgi:hypothetical protein
MGGDVYRITDERRANSVIYYILAEEFGWTKQEVDSQPFAHIKDMLLMVKEQREKDDKEMKRQSRKKSF